MARATSTTIHQPLLFGQIESKQNYKGIHCPSLKSVVSVSNPPTDLPIMLNDYKPADSINYNATRVRGRQRLPTNRCRIEFHDNAPDAKGRREFTLEWLQLWSNQINGKFYRRRGQVFHANPDDYVILDKESEND